MMPPAHVLRLLAAAALFGGCASPPGGDATAPGPAQAASERVDTTRAHSLVKEGAVLVDVRTADEYSGKHVDGAINVPVDDVAAYDFGAKDSAIVLYCQSGRRSDHAGEILRGRGYTRVYVLGPMSAWGP